MIRPDTRCHFAGVGGRYIRIFGVAAAISLLSGCSSTPDWANPVEWYRGASDAISGGDKSESASAEAAAPAQPTPGADKPFPNLASVPERPAASTAAEREAASRSLSADRQNARYSDETIRRQTDSDVAPPPPAPRTAPPPLTSAATAGSAPTPQVPAIAPSAAPAARAPAPQPIPASPPPSAPSSLPPLPGSTAGQATFAPPPPPPAFRPNPASQPPRFASAPPSPAAVQPLSPARRGPLSGGQSVARVGNPSFGAPPADIAAALGGAAPAPSYGPGDARFGNGQPAGTVGAGTGVAGERAAIISFEGGSANLSEADRNRLRTVAELFRQRGGAVRVEGHASSRTRDMDPVRHQMVNFDVSLNRANAVARELIRNGVPAESVFVAALSDSQPIFYEVMPAGDEGNQRVEIYFVN